MKRTLLVLSILTFAFTGNAQLNVDTLAIQDFEVVPMTPTWGFTGPVVYNQGYSTTGMSPASSPIGLGGSRAWETTTQSGGLTLDFDNVTIPAGYDSVRVSFSLAAFNLTGTSGGPDHLDYVLVEYSLDGGSTYVGRLRVRGASTNNSTWAYDATGDAFVSYLPATETMYQPTTSGLQTTEGYSHCEISFPGSITDIMVRITGRSSSASDTWMIDNVLITGENTCTNTTNTIFPVACDSYTVPSGDETYTSSGIYMDTIANAMGCDSILTIDLTIETVDVSISNDGLTLTAGSGDTYQWLDCDNAYAIIPGETSVNYSPTSNGNYACEVTTNGCTDTTACETIAQIGVEEWGSFADVILYPNPTNGEFTINLGKQYEFVNLEIFNIAGELILSTNYRNLSLIPLDLDYEAGVYIIQLSDGISQRSLRLMVE